MTSKPYISFRRQIWQQPVFSPEEPVFANGEDGEPVAPTRHQVDCWKAEASNFAATLDEPPYGRRDCYDLLATRAYQAGFAAARALIESINAPCTNQPQKRGDYLPCLVFKPSLELVQQFQAALPMQPSQVIACDKELATPTDKEIDDWWDERCELTRLNKADDFWSFDVQRSDLHKIVRVALTHWGRHAIKPVPADELLPAYRAGAADSTPQSIPVSDQTLMSIRQTTPRYRMSVIISTHDSSIDTRMHVIWSVLDPTKEILESVSLPEKLRPFSV